MQYSLKELFDFMELGKRGTVTCTDGMKFTGKCWAYSDVCNAEEDEIAEPSLEVGNTVIYLSQIDKIEYID